MCAALHVIINTMRFCVRSVQFYRIVVAWVLCLGMLSACTATTTTIEDLGGGSRISPDIVAQRFFEEFGAALNDPQLGDSERRSKLAEQLAEYFAPNERNDQRIALNSALANFAEGLRGLDENQTLSLQLRITDVLIVSETENEALVRPINGSEQASIYLLISRTTERGAIIPEYEQEVSFEQVFGRPNGTVPVVKIGDRWFLTEG
jgi:hypothetical protein